MPGGDRTGPCGLGARSGRGAGFCTGFNVPGYMNPGPGRGFWRSYNPGMGFGGHGWRNWFNATGQPGWMRGGWGGYAPGPTAGWTADGEKQMLEQQVQGLEYELDRIRTRLNEISAAKNEEE